MSVVHPGPRPGRAAPTAPATAPATAPPPGSIDPLAPALPGLYRDAVVEVRAVGDRRSRRGLATVRTPHFDLTSVGDRVQVEHVLQVDQVDDDIAGLVADELFGPGWLRGSDLFERIFTGIVRSLDPDPLAAWELFYRNTLRRVAGVADRTAGAAPGTDVAGTDVAGHAGSGGPGHGTIDEYAPVYAHAEGLLAPGSVLEMGCCFGFLALRVAGTGRAVTASDVAPGTVRLLGAMAPRLGLALSTVVADAAHHPGADGSVDTVLVLHLLEHVDADHGLRVIAEACRLARRRVVVAVPLEDVAEETWGHVRTITLADLDAWGRASGHAYDVHEHHGGWLVLDV